MDAHVVRRVFAALTPVLTGARLEKIHHPAPDLYTVTFYAAGHKQHLVLRAGRKLPLLYLSPRRPAAPSTPDAVTMRLRKYLCGKRVVDVVCHWQERRLAMRVASADQTWLVMDMREGVSLASAFAPAPDDGPWPDALTLVDACSDDAMPQTEGAVSEAWRTYPMLTPALRRTLLHMDRPDAAALLVDLEAGCGDLFLYERGDGPVALSAWPLELGGLPVQPPAQSPVQPPVQPLVQPGGMPVVSPGGAWAAVSGRVSGLSGDVREVVCEDPLDAALRYGEPLVFGDLAATRHNEAARPFKGESARLGRLLTKLDSEERRLRALLAERDDAVALQAVLYRYPTEARLDHVIVPEGEGERRIALDPRKTVRENMADMFHRSDRGARGLAMLESRRASVREERMAAEQARLAPDAPADTTAGKVGRRGAQVRARTGGLPKTVQAFRSDDGFRLLRGRSAEGNAALLKLASPHDLWMHAEDGPSAHLVIRRDHAAHDVPEQTLVQAGVLVGLKSWQREDAQARIMCAYVKDVKPVRGAPAGKVRVERTLTSLVVKLDATLETRLAEGSVLPGLDNEAATTKAG